MQNNAYMQTAADLFKLLADPTRARLLHALTHGEFCVCELTDATQAPQYTVSRNLSALRKGGWVVERRDGTWIYYRLAPARADLVKDIVRPSARHQHATQAAPAPTKTTAPDWKFEPAILMRNGFPPASARTVPCSGAGGASRPAASSIELSSA